MQVSEALAALEGLGDSARAAETRAYHKAPRRYLGVPVPAVDDLVRGWRETGLTVDDRVALAQGLWATDIHEARIAAARLLTQARIRPDEGVWATVAGWVPDLDAWAIADHAAKAGERRLVAEPARLDEVAGWVQSDHMWTRRAALVFTLPWTKQNNPTAAELAARDRVLGWCADLVADRDWFIQKAVAWWLRDLSKHDADRTRAFLAGPGQGLKPWAQKEAGRHLPL